MQTIDTSLPNAGPTRYYRWLVLFFISMAMFGNYYIYDSISPLADVLKAQLGFSDSNIGLLNAIYSIPNIFMVLIGGIIIDRIGTKKSAFLFAAFCLTGAIITASNGNLTSMVTGRLIFGLGAESLIVAVTTVIAKWFKGQELGFAMGINLTISRLASFTALNSPTLFKPLYANWQYPLFISVGAGVISMVSVIVYFSMESKAERLWQLGTADQVDKVNLGTIFKMNPSFWYISMLCVTFYSAIFPFMTFSTKFFIEFHGLSREMAGFTSSIIIFASMVGTPILGLLIDKIGKRATMMMFGSMLIIPVYLALVYTKLPPMIPMALMGVAFSLVPASMWPSVALIVESNRLGTAYGLMTMIQNIGLAGFNLMIGYANDATGGYVTGMWIFSILGFAGMLFAWLLKRADRLHNNGALEH